MKPMRNVLPFIFFFLCTLSVLSQKRDFPNLPIVLDKDGRIECATPTPLPEIAEQHEKLMQQFILRGANLVSPVAIPIKAHIVRPSNGVGGLSPSDLYNAISTMNTKYTTLKMSFYLCGEIHYIDSDAFNNMNVDKENDLLVLNNVNDALNIYFVGNLTSGSSTLNGISAFPSANPMENRMIMYNAATTNGVTLSHEMGHYWNLYHTHETFQGTELVNGSNCSTAGDLVCDTPADPCCYFYNTSTCVYTGTGTDANGQTYNPLISNLMSYYGLCRSTFTPGQYTRMDAGYALRMGYTGTNTYNFACNAPGAAPTNLTLSQSSCSVTLNWTDNANNEMGYIIEASPTSTGPFIAIGRVPANTRTYIDGRVLTNSTPYYYRVIAANANAIYSNTANIVVNWSTNCYCTPASRSCGEGVQISNVTIKQGSITLLDNTSTCAAINGYSYPRSTVPSLPKNNIFSISVSNPNYFPVGSVAWIDYDQSGTFDADEKIFTKTNGTWATQAVNFTVPGDAVEGLTRMRVRISWDSNVADACNNANGYGETEDYLVYIGCNLAPVATGGGTRCGTGTVTLSASGCTGGTINWYDSLTGVAVLGTGTSFTTPNIATSSVYYAGCTLASCSSSRAYAIATVYNTSLYGANVSRCGPGSLTLSVTGCVGGTVKWYSESVGGSLLGTGNTFNTPNLSNTQTYYVGCTLGECSSLLTGISAIINPVPAAPGTTNGGRCGSGQVTLTASGCSGGTIKWYTTLTGGSSLYSGGTYTTPSISSSTIYYAECSVNNCASSRTSAIATIDSPAAAPGAIDASRCGTGTVTLGATGCASGIINWYAAFTGGSTISTGSSFTTPSLSNTRIYYAGCKTGQCLSSLTAVTATVTSTPATPTTTGASRCGSGQVTLSASGCVGGTIKWYVTLTAGSSFHSGNTFTTLNISTTTTYYVECSVNTCTSNRVSVTATIDSPLAVPVATGASRCGPGKVTLAASGCSGGTIKWYANSSGGSAVGTGSSFLTPDLATTTTYYVTCASGSCESSRTAVVATVNITLSFGTITQSAGSYRASQTITSTANIATGTNYYAGKSIILTPGFQAGGSEVFSAIIQNCPN